ncbi:hypothetical protein DQQ10_05270 [Pseudochryseolinea flava]|uniref:Uncharacterized protein n=1 Tax=Pseudochryseolinea flava TaxID=2059302 RepID=A0A364Y7X7_9BACT|nr:hypothetical protein DQQ10_05270 [Pseudochryseolinea flava]
MYRSQVAVTECGSKLWELAYELETIESKINENISLAASESITVDVPEFHRELDSECAKIKKAFRHQVVSFENENLVKRYFHFHQESLIDLINTIQANTRAGSGDQIFDPVVTKLSDLLTYLEDHFPEYFDLDMKMPTAASNVIVVELSAFNETIAERFESLNVDIGLIQLIKNTIEQFIIHPTLMSFRTFYYFKFLRIHLSNLKADNSTETLDLIRLLMHCNFNQESFYQYFVRYIQWAVNKVASVNEKLDELAFYLKFANQEASVGSFAFNHNSVPVNIQIADWISQEVQYLKNKQQLSPMTLNAEDAISTEFKLNFDLSVSILAYLFRAFTETGVIQNKNTSELIRFLTKYVKTKRSESLSYESFRIKYYSVENGTKDAVKKMLQSVLNFINKN